MSDQVSIAPVLGAPAARPWHKAAIGCAVAAACAAPLLAGPSLMSTASAILVLGLFAMSMTFLFGFAGLPIIGHAVFRGIGAYIAAVLSIRWSTNLFVILFLAVLGAALAGFLFALVALRARQLQLMMTSIAFVGLIKALAEQLTGITGGDDGLSGIPPFHLAIAGTGLDVTLDTPVTLYLTTLIVVGLSYVAMRVLLASPFGQLVVAVRDNETRVRAIGIVPRHILNVWVSIASAFAGAAGALHVMLYNFVAPSILSLSACVTGLIMMVIGGDRKLMGGMVGAAVLFLVQDELYSITRHWSLILGLLLIVFVLATKGGIVGTVERLWRRSTSPECRR
ncbi:branched-chain amino acid ABC transporter permease [Bradyrhizobium sp. Arg237L]|uniref:branched-chain amino acid ABC transporter permease n=1 Tax=Bradyrhizobium sp. Arg237L TaxID=3003352 RepID=UPI00249DAD2E|nr:branched-chain amino acid ABC transporter permease [Bradyrhizobium sp. Arg237L]MDI4238304.1 branched-chain amino acid ABC transporter permease [Bradyrhizobium sp. Arg237L]